MTTPQKKAIMSESKAPKLKSIKGPSGSFPVEITVRHLNGNEASVTFECTARTQTEWSKLRDAGYAEVMAKVKTEKAKQKAAEKKAKAASEEDPTAETEAADAIELEKLFAERIKSDATLALKVASGWDLDEPFDATNVADMEDKFPGAIGALVAAYGEKVHGARVKN